MYAFNIAVVLY